MLLVLQSTSILLQAVSLATLGRLLADRLLLSRSAIEIIMGRVLTITMRILHLLSYPLPFPTASLHKYAQIFSRLKWFLFSHRHVGLPDLSFSLELSKSKVVSSRAVLARIPTLPASK